MTKPKLTAMAACRVASIDRDRFNEHVAAGRFGCAPATVPGRARLFDPDDMVALWLFQELMEDGFGAATAGAVACTVAAAARQHPTEPVIAYAQTYVGSPFACPAGDLPAPSEWGKAVLSGRDIRRVTTFNIDKLRAMIAHYTAEEAATIGERD